MTWTYSEEYYKQYTRDTWNESASGYGPMLRNLDMYSPTLLRLAAPRPGETVLDAGTGPGEPALTLARIVGAKGKVTGIDLSEKMIEKARERAKGAGLAHADFRVMDAEKLELPDASQDLVVNRFGLQIFTDPDKAIAETHRVLKPGGRFAACVWSSPGEKCPGINIFIEPMLAFAEPDETGYLPTPYEMGGPGELVEILRKAGFKDVREERHAFEWFFHSVDEYFAAVLEGTPIGHSLREEDKSVQETVMRKARENVKKYTFGGAVVAGNEAVFVTGRT